MMNRMRKVLILLMLILVVGTLQAQESLDNSQLKPEPHYGEEAQLVAHMLNTFHFRRMKLDDSLSAVILQNYIETLDNNKSYFLASDIESFQQYTTTLDDRINLGDVTPAYEIFDVFKQRFSDRINYIMNELIPMDFDYSIEESYDVDRSDNPWPTSEKELNEIWRKSIKNQSLSLKLNGKEKKDIQSIIRKRYERFDKAIKQYNSEDIFELYMNTVAESFDPHTNYLSPKTTDRFNQDMSLSLEGIGAQLQLDNDYTKVVRILPGGPAEKSDKIHENDRIIGVAQGKDGEMVDVIGWRLDDVVQLIKGPKDTFVRLEILPAETGLNGPSTELTLKRDKIKLEDRKASSELITFNNNGRSYKIGVVTLPSFYMDFEAYQNGDPDYTSTTRDVKKLVNDLEEKGIDGLLIDLRNNGGGSLAEAIDLTGLFIKEGPVVQVKTINNKIEVGADTDQSIAYDGPMAVLINRFSASASEIFAGAIQDYGRGVVLGEQTYGKGTVQNVIDLGRYLNVPADVQVGHLKITLQKFYRVTGSSTQHLGVSPDITFPSAFDAKEFGESSNKSALPWDQINSTDYNKVEFIDKRLVSKLSSAYNVRLSTDPGLKELVSEINQLRETLNKKSVSLNEATRKKEMEEAEKKQTQNRLTGAKVIKEGEGGKEDVEIDDQYLREGVIILSEMISAIG